jgi:PAS domain S-box-containing protein
MSEPGQNSRRSRLRLKHYAVAAALAWTAFIAASLGWSLFEQRSAMLDNARHDAQINFQKEMLFQFWMASHGGDAPATNNSAPTPDVARAQERAVVNPTPMLSQILGQNPNPEGYRSHLSSQKPMHTGNTPDAWETGALQTFAKGATEVASTAIIDGQEYMRVMRPLVNVASCQSCHGANDYQIGDIRGGMSVSVPLAPLRAQAQSAAVALITVDGIIWLLGLSVIGFSGRRIQAHNLERAKSETVLRESEVRYRTLADSGQALVWTSGPDKKCDYFNQPWLAFTGRTLEQALGDGRTEGIHPDDRPRCLKIYTTAFDRREPFSLVYRRRRHDGEFRWIQDDGSPRHDSQGNFVGYIGHCLDITERKQAEEKVRQLNTELERRVVERTAQLETANKELEAFCYSVSHDLRTPLRAVDGFSQAVLEDYGPQLPGDGQRQLQTIRESAQRMGELIDDLLTFSRLSRQALSKYTVATDQLVRSALADLSVESAGRQIEIIIGELPTCEEDPALLKQVWINLLSNALKFTRQRAPAVIEIGCRRQADETAFFVRDNGTGFDMRYADKLFRVFQRLHRAEDYEGTGVGLAIVQRVVSRHGGQVWVAAAEDQGATFYFTLEEKPKS